MIDLKPIKIKVNAVPIKGIDLEPGDLFSTVGPDYWEDLDRDSLGERVYIRTNAPCPNSQREVEVFKITIEIVEGKAR